MKTFYSVSRQKVRIEFIKGNVIYQKKPKKNNVLKPLGDSHEMFLTYKNAALYFTTIMTEKIDRYSSIQKLW